MDGKRKLFVKGKNSQPSLEQTDYSTCTTGLPIVSSGSNVGKLET